MPCRYVQDLRPSYALLHFGVFGGQAFKEPSIALTGYEGQALKDPPALKPSITLTSNEGHATKGRQATKDKLRILEGFSTPSIALTGYEGRAPNTRRIYDPLHSPNGLRRTSSEYSKDFQPSGCAKDLRLDF